LIETCGDAFHSKSRLLGRASALCKGARLALERACYGAYFECITGQRADEATRIQPVQDSLSLSLAGDQTCILEYG
jgi:hypothetical protein